jgi:ABC-type nitrate/sulfonate/bicarbonate transport system permease component
VSARPASAIKGDTTAPAEVRPAGLISTVLRVVRPVLIALALPALGIVVWWVLTDRMRLVDPALLPGPLAVLRAIGDWMFDYDGRLYSGTWLQAVEGSSQRVVTGFVFGSIAGVILGLLLGYFPRAAKFVEPSIHMLRSIPVISWLPLAFVFFGFGIASGIVLVGVGVFFPVVVNTMAGVRGVDRTMLRVGQMSGATTYQVLRWIILPGAMPNIVTGLRVGIGLAWVLVIVAEWTAVRTGLGFVLLDAYGFIRIDFVIAAMISVGVMGFISDRIVYYVTRPLIRWHTDTAGRTAE